MMFTNFNFLFLTISLIISSPVFSCEKYSNSDILKEINNYTISEIINKANNGDEKFQYFLGKLYFIGYKNDEIQVDKNITKAIPLLKSASKKDIGSASYLLSYYYGGEFKGVKNQDLYADYLLKSAECGIPDAQNELAHFYNDRKNGKYYSLSKAAYWYEKSAKNGNEDSILAIAYFYKRGIGVDINYEKAFYWYHQAVKQDDAIAELEIGKFYELGLGANSTSKCDTRLCSLNQFIKHFFRLLESQTLSRS